MEKEKYLKIAMESLSKVFSEAGARSTIDVMAKRKAKNTGNKSRPMDEASDAV